MPKRQNHYSAAQRQEDTLAQRWDRLLQDRAAISADVLTEFARIFAAADGEDFQSQHVVCLAAAEFYDTAKRLPKRQNHDTAEQRQEDTLARRWHRLVAGRAALSADLLDEFQHIFTASEKKLGSGTAGRFGRFS